MLTLNTWGLPYPIASIDRRRRFPAIQEFLQEHPCDVVGLQEVWRGALQLLDLDGLEHARENRQDTGLALLSPHPISDLVETSFSRGRGFDRLKQKGVLRARVHHPEHGPLWVFVTHLQAGAGSADAQVRAEQTQELIDQITLAGGPLIALGDFNYEDDQPADLRSLQRLKRAGLVDAADQAGATAATYPQSGQRYDRIFIRNSPQQQLHTAAAAVLDYDVLAGQPILSDHLPLWVQLEIEPSTRPADPPETARPTPSDGDTP